MGWVRVRLCAHIVKAPPPIRRARARRAPSTPPPARMLIRRTRPRPGVRAAAAGTTVLLTMPALLTLVVPIVSRRHAPAVVGHRGWPTDHTNPPAEKVQNLRERSWLQDTILRNQIRSCPRNRNRIVNGAYETVNGEPIVVNGEAKC